MRTALTFLFALVCSIAVAHTDGIYNPTANSVGDTQGIDSNGGSSVAPSTGPALLVNSTSTALLIDNTNSACLAGGGC